MVGQVNALAVYQMGDIAFGRPSRITAETYMGKKGVINIERRGQAQRQDPRQGGADSLRLSGPHLCPELSP